jgi:phosphate transport system ATP-binding protein
MAVAENPFDLSKLSTAREVRFGDDEVADEQLPWPQFTVADLNFYYGDFHALHDLNLILPANRVTGLIGPSGCGKSTFLRTLNRMYEAVPHTRVTGTVLLGQADLFSFAPTSLRRRVGMVFQKPSPFPKSIFDNIAYGLQVNHIAKRYEIPDLVEDSLKRAALWDEVKDKLHDSALSLSGGQQQRLCIARALAVKPEVLLLDEPCSALDPIATAKIEDLIFELRRSCTIVIVTHNMLQAARIADYAGFFLQGKLVEFNSAKTLFTRPENKLTEDYITGRFG